MRARLFGSCAIWLLCEAETSVLEAVHRVPKDVDVVVEVGSVPQMIDVLSSNGWVQDREVRVWSEGTRLRFRQPALGRLLLDVSVDFLRFAQILDLRGRLAIHGTCIAPTDLLLSKLQITQKTYHDHGDVIALLSSHSIGPNERDELNRERVDNVRSSSWRWDMALQRAREECTEWNRIFTPDAGLPQLDSAKNRLFEVLDVKDRRVRGIRWYLGAALGRLTGVWFDEVEQPWTGT